jgi:PAS domain S-box-containing protein
MSAGGESEWGAPVMRAASFAIIAFQVGYTVLDGGEYRQAFARTLPLHIASMSIGAVAFTATLSPRLIRHWRPITLAICLSILACTLGIAVIDADRSVLVASILLFVFAAGALIPWGPGWQAALEAAGALAFLGYSIQAADPYSRLAIAWMMLLCASLLSQLSAVHRTRYRMKLAEQVEALSENHRLLTREMDLREQLSRAREREHSRYQQSESMLRKVFEASPDNIAVNSLVDGRFIAVNDEYEVAGYTRDDVMGTSVVALGTWQQQADMARFLDSIQKTGRVKNMEVTQRGKDGSIEMCLISASVVEVNGEPCVISMTRDITEIKRTETRLRESHATLRKILKASADAIVVSRVSDGAFVDFNQRFGLSGYTLQDLNASRTGSIRLYKNPEQQKVLRERVMADGIVRNVEVEFVTVDGLTVPTMVSALKVELDGEDCLVTMVRDLTAQKEASRKIEESAKAVKDIFDVSPDAISVNRVSDGKFVACNDEFLRLTGYTREEAMASSAVELEVFTDPADRLRLATAVARDGTVRNLEIEVQTSSRTRVPTLVSASMINLGSELCVVAYIRDITAIKRTEVELVAAREAALAASRAKSEFLSSMSHEIRTPMNAILGMADLLAESELGDEQRRYVNTVLSNGNALLALINSILDLAKVESGRISLEAVEFDPREVTEKVLETLAIRAHEKGVELMARFATGVPDVAIGDPLRLGQILINLVGNAIKFTPDGQVLVSVEPDPNSTTAGLKFAVSDTGIGIPADKLHLLFHAFTQADSSTSRKYGGSGLGLAIVSRLVALMHGKVEVASEPGKGSIFAFTAEFGIATREPALSGTREAALDGVGILIVDNNPDARSILSEMLSAQGANVTQVSSGEEAIAEIGRNGSRASSSASPFQIVLLDSKMPGLGGFETAKRLVSEGSGTPQIVMMLGTDDLTSKVTRLRAIGVDNYVVKPVRRDDLFRAIARARESAPLNPLGDALLMPAIVPVATSSPTLERPLHILIADDSYDNRALIKAYLKKTPYRLEQAEDGQQAIDKFVAGRFDLVLMDIQMPNVDGYEATKTIRGWEREHGRRHTPVVALTASALEDAADRSRAAGCDAHVTKPVKKSTLLNAILDAVKENPLADEHADGSDLKGEIWTTE